MRKHDWLYARFEYHTQLTKMSFEENFDLTAGGYLYFGNMFLGEVDLFAAQPV